MRSRRALPPVARRSSGIAALALAVSLVGAACHEAEPVAPDTLPPRFARIQGSMVLPEGVQSDGQLGFQCVVPALSADDVSGYLVSDVELSGTHVREFDVVWEISHEWGPSLFDRIVAGGRRMECEIFAPGRGPAAVKGNATVRFSGTRATAPTTTVVIDQPVPPSVRQ